jgi:hypothetical protein
MVPRAVSASVESIRQRHLGRAILVAALLAGLMLTAGVQGPSELFAATSEPGPSVREEATSSAASQGGNSVLFGAWVGKSVDWAADESAWEWAIGKQRKIRHWYWTNKSDIPGVPGIEGDAAKFKAWLVTMKPGQILMLSWAPAMRGDLESVNRGVYDAYIRMWGQAFKDYGQEVWLRAMWEDNASFYWWGSGADWNTAKKSAYKDAFCRVKRIVKDEIGATNVKTVWSPIVSGYAASAQLPSYPGDDCVDIVGLDGYPFTSGNGGFLDTFQQEYRALSTLGKPIIIAETSIKTPTTVSDADRAREVSDLLTNVIPTHLPELMALVWFDEPPSAGGSNVYDSLLNPAYPRTRQAFSAGIAGPPYVTLGDAIPPPGGPPPDPQANRLANGDFESGLAGWVMPTWYGSFIKVDEVLPHTGKLSLHAEGRSSGPTIYQDVRATPAETLTVSGWVHAPVATGDMSLVIELQPYNQNNGAIQNPIVVHRLAATTVAWTRFAQSVTMPAGTAFARARVRFPILDGVAYIDDLAITTGSLPPAETAPNVAGTAPSNGATGVAANASITVTFGEPVNASASAFTLSCDGAALAFSMSTGSPATSFRLDPTGGLPVGKTCTAAVLANQVSDADSADPPDQMEADHTFSFSIAAPPPVGAERLVNPGFESDLVGWERPSWAASISAVQSTTVRSGTRAFRFSGKAQGLYLQQEVGATAGEILNVSGWLNVTAVGQGMSGYVELLALNANRGTLATYRIHTFSGITGAWQRVSLSQALPSSTAFVRLRVRFPTLDGSVFLDDVSITIGP